jgi:hypothetical protein
MMRRNRLWEVATVFAAATVAALAGVGRLPVWLTPSYPPEPRSRGPCWVRHDGR